MALRCIARVTYGPDRKTLNMVAVSLVQSRLDYGCQLFASAAKTTIEKLDSVRNDMLRMITGAFRTSPSESLHVEANIMPLKLHREYVMTKALLKMPIVSESPMGELFHEAVRPSPGWPISRRGHEALVAIGAPRPEILPFDFTSREPWSGIEHLPRPCLDNAARVKGDCLPLEMRLSAGCHITDRHSGSIHVYTDGSKINNKVGAAVFCDDFESSMSLPPFASIFTAELCAILMAIFRINFSSSDHFTIF